MLGSAWHLHHISIAFASHLHRICIAFASHLHRICIPFAGTKCSVALLFEPFSEGTIMQPACVLAYIPESMWNKVEIKKVTQSFNTQFAVIETDIVIVLEIESSAIITCTFFKF